MDARIILHGGNAQKRTDKNDKFFTEIIGGVNSDIIHVLCIYFARPEHRWEESYGEDQYMFHRIADDRGVEIETSLASYDMADFAEKVAESDVIFINGGMKGHLKDTLLLIGMEQFRDMIKDKTLVGISAGANVLAKYYYSSVTGGIREGAGFLNIKLLTHHSEDEPEKLSLLKSFREDLPIVTVAEEEYIVINA